MKKIAIFTLLAFTATLSAFAHFEKIYPDALQEVVSKQIYRGDTNGDFKGDTVYILSDGSHWKIHADDLGKCSSWQNGQPVNIRARMDWCLWCKPKHQFLIYNRALNETAKVMLVAHAAQPKKIVKVEVLSSLYALVTLSDSKEWIVPRKISFIPGERIYVGSQGIYGKDRDFVLIKGRESESQWSFAKLKNADYSLIQEN
ncbi:MAG: hypothetical protein KDK50_04285 [Chlamydiia bacterium]|nr:hypothetical protein [Chlamydiia bacterium]MCP5492625.1 hypothetical protein [Chlamydiales bacterium]